VVTDADGNEWFVLSNTNESTGVELIFIDFKNNTAEKFRAPAGSGAWMLNQVPGERLIVGTYYAAVLRSAIPKVRRPAGTGHDQPARGGLHRRRRRLVRGG
jgi:hypothetical protein